MDNKILCNVFEHISQESINKLRKYGIINKPKDVVMIEISKANFNNKSEYLQFLIEQMTAFELLNISNKFITYNCDSTYKVDISAINHARENLNYLFQNI